MPGFYWKILFICVQAVDLGVSCLFVGEPTDMFLELFLGGGLS